MPHMPDRTEALGGEGKTTVYLTPSEKKAIEAYVATLDRSVSWFLRQAALAALTKARQK